MGTRLCFPRASRSDKLLKTKWRNCDHPRTPENIIWTSFRDPRGRCRECRKAYRATPEYRALFRAAKKTYEATPLGRVRKRLWDAKRYTKRANARDDALLAALKGGQIWT